MRKINALLSYHFKIPFPEDLTDDVWAEKWEQIKWLQSKGVIPKDKE